MERTTDVLIIGAGPAGIFTAYELLKNKSNKKIVIIEQGRSIERRSCPKPKTGKCVNCKPYCNITTGFSGAGAFSDGKLSLSPEVGGDLPELVGHDTVVDMIAYTDNLYLELGADTHIEGANSADEKVREIRRKAISAGLQLVDCPIRHLGTEKARELYLKLERQLQNQGVEIIFDASAEELLIKDGNCTGAAIIDRDTGDKTIFTASKTIVAVGRVGADWLDELCRKNDIKRRAGVVDIGVRVECRNEVMEEVNCALYESKLVGYVPPYNDKVRTFCQNPGGFVSQENYDGNLAVVNGHSYKDNKSANTNVAILSSHHFRVPFDQPIEYAKRVGELTNMLANGHILVQRFGDILEGKRTWEKELQRSNVRPTLPDAVAGDITAGMPYRPMLNIINFIKAMDNVVPGFASKETLLYSPEIKFYSNKIEIDKTFETSVKNLYTLGDGSGWTRGLMQASLMGVLCARTLF